MKKIKNNDPTPDDIQGCVGCALLICIVIAAAAYTALYYAFDL